MIHPSDSIMRCSLGLCAPPPAAAWSLLHLLLPPAAGATGTLARRTQAPPTAAFSVTSAVDVDKLGPIIPQSFMGLSHEWPNVEEMFDIPQYVDVIKQLQSYGSGPLVLRIGGGSTDKQTKVPEPTVWQALAKLHAATGMQYIIGLNFFSQDYDLAKGQMDAARKYLPASAILSFEIGNEVCFPMVLMAVGGLARWAGLGGQAAMCACGTHSIQRTHHLWHTQQSNKRRSRTTMRTSPARTGTAPR